MRRPLTEHPLVMSSQNGKKKPFVALAVVQLLAILVLSEILNFAIWESLGFFQKLTTFSMSPVVLNALKDLYIPFASVIVTVFLWVILIEKRSPITLGFFFSKSAIAFPSPLKTYALGLFLGFFTMGLFLLSGLLLGFYTLDRATFTQPSSSQLMAIVIIFFGWLIQGAAEEILVRGFLFQACMKKSILTAALVSSAVFSMLHLGNSHLTGLALFNLFLYGLLALLLALFTESLWASAAYHGAWNFSQGNLFGISVSGNDTLGDSLFHFHVKAVSPWISGGDFGAEGSIFVSLLLLGTCLMLIYGLSKRYRLSAHRLI